ncbi:MAG: hypothetical protein QXS68_05815 [Candidatus Methanomethylicaceae archaeon]
MKEETKTTQVVNEKTTQKVVDPEVQVTEEQENFDIEYVRKLRAEAAEYRRRLRELESRVKAEEESKLTEQEKLQKRLAELEKAQADWERERQEILLQRYVENAAVRLGIIDPEAAWKLLDLKEVEFDEEGKPENVEALLRSLIQKKPYLANALARSAGAGNGASVKTRYSMNDFIRRSSGRR